MDTNTDQALEALADSFWKRIFEYLHKSEALLRWARMIVLLGGLVATAGGIGASAIDDSGVSQIVAMIGIVGAVLAVVCVAIQLLFEREQSELFETAKNAVEQSRAYIVNREKLSAEISDMERLAERRLSLHNFNFTALSLLAPLIGASNQKTDKQAVEDIFAICGSDLLASMAMTHAEKTSITVYRVDEKSPTDRILTMIKTVRPNKAEERRNSRVWKVGEGYSGMAALRQVEVVVADTMVSGVQTGFHMPPEKVLGAEARSVDEEHLRYRSVAAVPIMSGVGKLWGVVTVSSSMAGRFSIELGNDTALHNVEAVRSLARMIAFFATVCDKHVEDTHILGETVDVKETSPISANRDGSTSTDCR